LKTRRDFLKKSISSIAAISPLMGLLSSLEKLEAADINGDYKAIVCVLLEGGCDSFNMVVPTNSSAYADYKTIRGDIAVNQSDLISFTHTNENGLNSKSYGMRNNMSQMSQLFNDKRLSIIGNIGTLIKPVTKLIY